MYVINGIAYSGDAKPMIKVKSVRPLDGYKLLLRFSNNEKRIFDFSPLLDMSCYVPLKNKSFFDRVYIDYGCTVWNDDDIDISPEFLYENGIPVEDSEDT
jgi:hypothetical protein